MRNWHRVVGIIGIVIFLLTGVYMRLHVPAMPDLDDASRLLLRSRHIYLLLASLVNLTTGVNYRVATGRFRRWIQAAGSVLLLAAPLLLLLAFFIEPQQVLLDRKLAARGIICVAIGAISQLAGIQRTAGASDALHDSAHSSH